MRIACRSTGQGAWVVELTGDQVEPGCDALRDFCLRLRLQGRGPVSVLMIIDSLSDQDRKALPLRLSDEIRPKRA